MRLSKKSLIFVVFFAAALSLQAATRPIYNEDANAGKILKAGIARASRTGKNVALIFGANWCSDCHALDEQMHKAKLARIIQRHFVVVKINVGRFDKNVEFAAKYGVPIKQGIPAIAILDPHGKLLYAQDQGQFANAGKMEYEPFVDFFEKWEPKKQASAGN